MKTVTILEPGDEIKPTDLGWWNEQGVWITPGDRWMALNPRSDTWLPSEPITKVVGWHGAHREWGAINGKMNGSVVFVRPKSTKAKSAK